ncbi:MAG: TrbG/VirB9 family P-type conjugative transfer protein [Rhizomicrobium sp.]
MRERDLASVHSCRRTRLRSRPRSCPIRPRSCIPSRSCSHCHCLGNFNRKPRRGAHVARPPKSRVEAANLAVLQEPTTDGYINAIQVYPYSEGALYRLYATPQEVSDIALQPGESLTAISAGDTTRWVVGDTTSGSGASKQVHILAKPFAAIFGPISSSPPIVGAITSSSKAPTGPIWRQSPGPIRRMVW